MRQVNPLDAKQAVEKAFYRWGLPKRMRFDNGYPFANTNEPTVPTALSLWLVSLGIDVIFNRPHSPQQNGSVECTQRISSKWSGASKCVNTDELQSALDKASHEHIHVLRQRSKADTTRIERHPELENNDRLYHPNEIQPQRVKEYLSKFVWRRTVYSNGRITMFGKQWAIGTKYAQQEVIILYDKGANKWNATVGNRIATISFDGPDLSKEAIANLTIFSKNLTT